MEIQADQLLNVTLLEPRQKHPTIFLHFDDLPAGGSLVILNDHDPKPLYYQLLGERGNIFTWEYLEQGPQWWKVRITKRRLDEGVETIGAIAAKDYRKARIFKKYGLDYCCGGKKTVQEACQEKGIDATRLEQELQQEDALPHKPELPYKDWTPEFLAEYIVNTHHHYVRNTLPELLTLAEKVNEVHGVQHPELIGILERIRSMHHELNSHMVKEEKVLFPYIRRLAAHHAGTNPPEAAALGSVQMPIHMMELEHEEVGTLLAEIRKLSGDYTLPKDACASYQLLYHLLQEFEEDLHLHVHLENNILFPAAITLEHAFSTHN